MLPGQRASVLCQMAAGELDVYLVLKSGLRSVFLHRG